MDSKRMLYTIRQSKERKDLVRKNIKGLDMDAFSFYSLASMNAETMAMELNLDSDLVQSMVFANGIGNDNFASNVLSKYGEQDNEKLKNSFEYCTNNFYDSGEKNEILKEAELAKCSIILTHVSAMLKEKCNKRNTISKMMQELVEASKGKDTIEMGEKNQVLIDFYKQEIGDIYPQIENEKTAEREEGR